MRNVKEFSAHHAIVAGQFSRWRAATVKAMNGKLCVYACMYLHVNGCMVFAYTEETDYSDYCYNGRPLLWIKKAWHRITPIQMLIEYFAYSNQAVGLQC